MTVNREVPISISTTFCYDMDIMEQLEDDDWEEIMVKTMEAACYLGCSVLVQHCTEFDFPEDEFQIKYKIVKKRVAILEKLCAKYKIQVALENVMPYHQTKNVEDILRNTSSDWIGFCYDSSHDQIIPGEGFIDFGNILNIIDLKKQLSIII